MPLSGSYYYPQVQVPNSSYPTMDLREVTTPTSSSMVGRVFVDTDGFLKYLDPDGVVHGLSILSGSLVTTGSFQINGDLTVFGNATYISSSNLLVNDPLIVMARSQSAAPSYDGGFIVERGTSENVGLIWDESEDIFSFIRTNEDGSTAGNITINGYRHLKVDNLSLNSGSIYSENEHLVLSSSAGSVVKISGTLYTNTVVADSDDMVLSSSFSSYIVASGNLKLDQGTADVSVSTGGGDIIFANSPVVGSWELPEDGGPIVLVDMPVSATASIGDEMSYEFALDSNAVAKVYGEADGAGGVQNLMFRINAGVLQLDETTTPAATSSIGALYTKSDNILYFQTGDGDELAIGGVLTFKSYALSTGAVGTHYLAGYYDAPAADVDLTQASTTVTFGNVSDAEPWGGHAFVVASGAGSTDGSDLVLTVTGTSITDAGVRVTSDSEVVVADCVGASTNQYFETTKKWLGRITFTLSSTGGTTFSFTFNYGMAKYEDFGNRNFVMTDVEFVGQAGATNTLDLEVLHHQSTGWTYHATAFVPGSTPIVQMSSDYSGPETTLTNGEPFAWKRVGLSESIVGNDSEGVVVRITAGGVNLIDHMTAHIGVLLN